MTENHIFGPVMSRRLGRSLGIDLLPFKTCSYDCVYCECGATTHITTKRAEFFPTEEVISQLDTVLRERPTLDYITFAGSGEPTLSLSIGRIIRHLKTAYPEYKVAVLTNGSLLGNKEVAADLSQADLVIPTLTSTSQETFEKIHRPDTCLLIKTIISDILEFRKEFHGEIWLEIFLIPDLNTSLEELASLRDVIDKIQPARIQLNTLDRPAAEDWVTAPDPDELENIRKYFAELKIPVDVAGVCCEQPDVCRAGESTHEQILKTLRIRPSTVEDLASMTGLHHHEVAKYLSGLLEEGTVHIQRGKRGVFYFAGPNTDRK
ncbi:MAG TPA: radical SAM protein [Methanocorpusculum sp.]|jgi:wyosine [tRNA(Phe)-imidazoG37] synthetase (radical SAM superfamily)|uniref:radical SAM protein n=1 Tax=Methanocorpusculum sp. GPch4 TaxID=2527877 RepID=UPI001433334E|nr:radical SAM protein [Methanocorpusculum sp. GPch4]HJJ38461.1 radical SAM protein [Methanocorpusculum sp.]